MHIKILGSGAWGRGIAHVLQENGHSVHFLKRGCVTLDSGDTLILALPTNAIREALSPVRSVGRLRVINCTKGIELQSHKLPHEIVKEILPVTTHYYALLGPSFANELQEKMPTLVNLGYTGSVSKARAVKQLFETSYLRIHLVQYIPSLELAGVMKNVCAIVCGISAGLHFGMNTRTKVIITAIEEYYLLCKKLDYPIDEVAISGIIGDFMLTGNSETSRNFQFGKLLVKMSVEQALLQVDATVEGYASLHAISARIKQAKVTLPLVEMVKHIVYGDHKDSITEQFLSFTQSV